MRVYITTTITIATLVLVSFLVVEAFGVPLLVDPSEQMGESRIAAGVIGVGLLWLDVFIPVPSSIIMIANGAIFGVVGGAVMTLVGAIGGAMLGFAVGRRGTGLIRRFISDREQRRADALIDRWGTLAIIVSRPIPILAETVAVVAGTTAIGWRHFFVTSTLGIIPAAVIYAIAGAFTTDLRSGVLIFLFVILIAALTWIFGRRLEARMVHRATNASDEPR